MPDREVFVANPYLGGLKLAPPAPLLPSWPGVDAPTRAVRPRSTGPDGGFDPLTPADARMFLGRAYDPATIYRRHRITGQIEPMGAPPPLPDKDETTQVPEGLEAGKPTPSDRERLLELGRREQNYSPMPVQQVAATAGDVAQRGLGRRVLDAADNAFRTANNWKNTRVAKAASGIAGIPRTVLDGTDEVLDYAIRALGGPDDVPPLAYKHLFPTQDEAYAWILRRLQKDPRFRETHLPGEVGAYVDKGFETILAPIGGKRPQPFGFLRRYQNPTGRGAQ